MGKNAEGIILKGMDYRENDRILRILTLEHGKISAIARGVRKAQSNLRGAIEPITLAVYHLNPGRNMFTISQAEVSENYFNIKNSLEGIVSASLIIDLTDSFLEENNPDEETYDLLKNTLALLDATSDEWQEIAFFFEINIHRIHGILPDIYRCISCGSKEAGNRIRIDVDKGGVLCAACSKENPRDESYPVEVLFIIEKASNHDISEFINKSFEKTHLYSAWRLIARFTRHYLGKELKSRDALDLHVVKYNHENRSNSNH